MLFLINLLTFTGTWLYCLLQAIQLLWFTNVFSTWVFIWCLLLLCCWLHVFYLSSIHLNLIPREPQMWQTNILHYFSWLEVSLLKSSQPPAGVSGGPCSSLLHPQPWPFSTCELYAGCWIASSGEGVGNWAPLPQRPNLAPPSTLARIAWRGCEARIIIPTPPTSSGHSASGSSLPFHLPLPRWQLRSWGVLWRGKLWQPPGRMLEHPHLLAWAGAGWVQPPLPPPNK